jgi:hypothetical protein
MPETRARFNWAGVAGAWDAVRAILNMRMQDLSRSVNLLDNRVRWGSPHDFGAPTNGIADARSALAQADGVGQTQVLGEGTYLVGSNLTLAANWVFLRGAKLKPASGITVTISGALQAGAYQVFDISAGGTVNIGGQDVLPEWYGATGDGSTNDVLALEAALVSATAAGGRRVLLDPFKTYGIAATLDISLVQARIDGRGTGRFFTGPVIKWVGAADASSAVADQQVMVKVLNAAHGAGIGNLILDADSKAGICLQVIDDGAGGSTGTFGPWLPNLGFKDYRKRAAVFGLNTDVEGTPTGSNMQMGTVWCPNWWFAGSADNTAAIGVLVNAQNAEWIHFPGVYFDPSSDDKAHRHHIYALRGGVKIDGGISSRSGAVSGEYAFVFEERFSIDGLNCEDRYVVTTTSADPGGPCSITNLLQRDHTGPDGTPAATDRSILIRGTEHTTVLNGITVQGMVSLGGTDRITVVALGVISQKAADPFEFQGPANHYCIVHDADTGHIRIRGAAARLVLSTTAGVRVAEMGADGIYYPSHSDATRGVSATAGRTIYNTTDGNLNVDTGAGWILPDGTAT